MNSQTRPRVAIVGSGISGLTAAYRLHPQVEIDVFEQNDWIRHTHTVEISVDGTSYAVDTGFIVFNEWTYPRFLNLLSEIGLPHQDTDMSFSVMSETTGIEYAGTKPLDLSRSDTDCSQLGITVSSLDIMRFNKRRFWILRQARLSPSKRSDNIFQNLI